jgi:hypothetical protein
MSQVTHLASGALTRSGDSLTVELHQPLDSPSFVMVVWPQKSSITAATPKALAALAAAMVRTLAEAQAELAAKIRNSRWTAGLAVRMTPNRKEMIMRFQPGSCVRCGRGTDTGFATEGEGEWHVAALIAKLGIGEEDAMHTTSAATHSPSGNIPTGTFPMFTRLCGQCAKDCGVSIALLLQDQELPTYRQPAI